jgi:serine/threonine protein kinase
MGAGRGLAAAHAKGLVHRDFKPSNVLIGLEGQAVVVDFGLARHLDTLERDAEQIGRFEGSVDYAPPERLCGQPGDERADQFSFCVALWEALSGVNPFGACTQDTTPQARVRAIEVGVAGTPRGSRRVARALRRGLSLRPSDRFASMEALMAALAPKRRAWPTKALLLAVVAGAVLAQCVPSRPASAPAFVESVHASCLGAVASVHASGLGVVAVAYAHQGSPKEALDALQSARSARRSNESSRALAIASKAVALELEKQMTASALISEIYLFDAWSLAVCFARDAGDAELQQEAWDQHEALIDHLKAGRPLPRRSR